MARQAQPKALAKYVLFTNLRLGLESESTTTNGRSLNIQRAQLREEVPKGSVGDVDVTIIGADQISGFIARHPALRMGWFSPGQGTAWNEMQQRARRLSRVDVPFIGRDAELADLQGWLGDPDVRVIAVSGPNSVGKTRLVIEATEPYAPVAFFAEDVHALLQDGVRAYATAEQSVVLVVEDPPVDMAKRLAEQAVGCEKPVKLIITLPSPEHAPVIRLGDESYRRFALSCARENNLFGFRSLRGRNNGNSWLDNASFFSRDFGNCFAQPLFVIEMDWRDHRNI